MTQDQQKPDDTREPARGRRWLSRGYVELAAKLSANAHAKDKGPDFDVVIVGSGYGGAVAAAELSTRTGLRICVLERGQEYLPGMFPSRLAELAGHLRFSTTGHPKPRGNVAGLFDIRMGKGVGALVANGLGGGSLINGAVMEKPKFGSFNSGFPANVEQDLTTSYLDLALAMLEGSNPGTGNAPAQPNTIQLHPHIQTHGPLHKTAALEALAKTGLGTFRPAALTIEMQGRRNAEQVDVSQCTLCGDCMTGCNVGARRSLDTNLLVRAARNKADIYTGTSVLQMQRKNGLWRLEVVSTDTNARRGQPAPLFLTANRIILAAGTLGSTEILMRSGSKRLTFSSRLGEQFSCNGDNLAAVQYNDREVRSGANECEPLTPASKRAVGPTITGVVEVAAAHGAPSFLVQEFAVPGPLKLLFEELVTTGVLLRKMGQGDWSCHTPGNGKDLDPLAVDPDAIKRTAIVGLIGHDAATGKLKLPRNYLNRGANAAGRSGEAYEGGVRIEWEDAPTDPSLERAFNRFAKRAESLGTVIPNPMWKPLPDDLEALAIQGNGPVLTVHPLGGCAMADNSLGGVVDEFGAVFDCGATDTTASDSWMGTLLVLDGAVVPRSLGANPALTIAAIALRAMDHWCAQWGAVSPASKQAPPPLPPRPVLRTPQECITTAPLPTQFQVVERLVGPLHLPGRGNGDFVLELTFSFQPAALAQMVGPMGRRLALDHSQNGTAVVNCLRIFDAGTWRDERLDMEGDESRGRKALVTARLDGFLRLLDREPSSRWGRIWRGGWAYIANRGLRDFWQMWLFPRRKNNKSPGFLATVGQGIRLASMAGEVRLFEYCMTVTQVLEGDAFLAPFGSSVKGQKRLTYGRGANPWIQLLYLDMITFPGAHAPARLKVDARFLARNGLALVRITQQADQVSALADLASFGVYGLRLMLSIHAWSFRAPDPLPMRKPVRLPGPLAGMPPPQIRELDMPRMKGEEDKPVRVRLTRYAQPPGSKHAATPLVMIHGYSASGTTFAHHALEVSMAEYFWKLGRDIWILDLRTSAGMPTAKMPWHFEDAAWEDIPLAIAHIAQQVGGELSCAEVKVDVFAHCIGAVMLSMAILSDHSNTAPSLPAYQQQMLQELPGRLHKVILSQKGFALSYTDANVLRAYLMRYLRKVLLPDKYEFRADMFPSAKDRLIDRALSSLPYPPSEFDRENPMWPCAMVPWTASRHRMDALYERTFNVKNMPDKVLEYIDDFFGPLNIDTVSQTIHFARFNTITNAEGRNRFVTAKGLKNWPRAGTLSIHGSNNGMVDDYTLRLMRDAMDTAGIPFEAHLLQKVNGLDGVGHQDSLIGNDAKHTFAVVETFLAQEGPPPLTARPCRVVPRRQLHVPWLGPRLHMASMPGLVMTAPAQPTNVVNGEIQLMVMCNPGWAEATAIIVPVTVKEGCYTTLAPRGGNFKCHALTPYSGWMVLPLFPVYDHRAHGYLVLVLPQNGSPTVSRCFVQQQLNRNKGDFDAAYVASEDVVALLPQIDRDAPLHFAVASCQYPAGVLDGQVADASLAKLAARISQPTTKASAPQALVLAGDQIYSDATAGLLDPATETDRYGRSHEEWLARPPLRNLMRRIPVHCMLDDHELADNWEPAPGARRVPELGLESYWNYQRGMVAHKSALWNVVTIGSFEVFIADTRTRRTARNATHAAIMDANQLNSLEGWLMNQKEVHDKGNTLVRPKFVVSPVWLLPRRLGRTNTPDDPGRCDAWEAYPASLCGLLRYIAEKQIRGVIFLSGDAHIGGVAVARTQTNGSSITTLCINAPALYAPFAFANGQPADYLRRDSINLGHGLVARVRAEPLSVGDGFVRISALKDKKGWNVTTEVDGQRNRVFRFAVR